MSNDDFIKGCKRSQIPTNGRPHVLSVLGKKIGIFQKGEEIYALEMSCKHQGADLSKGPVDNGVVTCPRHGYRYDLTTGECVEPNNGMPLRFHEVRVEGDQVWVALRPPSW